MAKTHRRPTTQDAIDNLTFGPGKSPSIGDLMKSDGFFDIGDGGSGTWEFKGLDGQQVSQSPAQLAAALLNDASGNQWALNTLDDIAQLGGVAGTDITLALAAAKNSFKFVIIGEGDYTVSASMSTFITFGLEGAGAGKTNIFLTSASTGTSNIFITASDNLDGSDRWGEFSIRGITFIRQTNTQGRVIEVSGVFAKNQSVILDDVIFRGDTTLSASPFYFDRCAVIGSIRVAEIQNCRVHGNIDTTADPSGQYQTIAFESTGAAGSHSYRSTDVFTTHTAIKCGDNVEGVYFRGCNLVNVVTGLDLSTTTGEPGGWIDGVHINAIETCVKATNRSSMVITDLVLFRSDQYFETAEWVGLDLDGVTSTNINGLQLKPQVITTNTIINVRLKDTSLVNFSDLYLTNGTGIKSLGGNDTVNIDNVVFHKLDTSLDLDATDERIYLGVHQFIAMSAEYGTIPDKQNLTIKARGVRYNGVDTSDAALTSGSGTQVIRPSIDKQIKRYSLAGTYTQNIDIRGFESFRGDSMTIIVEFPVTATPTVRVRDQESTDILLTVTGSGAVKRFSFDMVYSGSRWEYRSGGELVGAV